MIKIFYTDYITDESISFQEAVKMDINELKSLFLNMEAEEDNFLGLSIKKGLTLQFMCLNEQTWLADIPAQDKLGSYAKECSVNECLELIDSVYFKGAEWEIPDGLAFTPW